MPVDYLPPSSRNGNIRIAPISLNTASMVNPMILKGRRISHASGNIIIKSMASGQQRTSSIHHNRTARRKRIGALTSNNLPAPEPSENVDWVDNHLQF